MNSVTQADPPPPRLAAGRRRRVDDTAGRERLLEVAIALFAERGIANTTLAQIAAAGGVTPAMMHYWFISRENLIDAVVEERLAPLIARTWDGADIEGEGAVDLVRGVVDRMLAVTREAPWLPSLWVREIIQVGGLLNVRVMRHIPCDRNIAFRRRIAEAQARGEISSMVSPDFMMVSILALVMLPQAAARNWQAVNPDLTFDRDTLENHIRALVLGGLTLRDPAAAAGMGDLS